MNPSPEFGSLRDEIVHLVNAAAEPITSAELFEQSQLAEDKQQLADILCRVAKHGLIVKRPAPDGASKGAKFVYSPGTGKFSKPRVNARVVEPKPIADRTLKDLNFKPTKGAAASAPYKGARWWALRSDGAFILLGTNVEIARADARSLIDFVRTLDRGEASA